MRIGELSKATGVSIATIRLYEREGLIDPASRTEGKLREFTRGQQCRLDFIKRIRNIGFSLDDVKALLALSSATGRTTSSELMERIHDGIASRKRDLDRLENCLREAGEGVIPLESLDKAFQTRQD